VCPSILKLCLHKHLCQSVSFCRYRQSRLGFDFLGYIVDEIKFVLVILFFLCKWLNPPNTSGKKPRNKPKSYDGNQGLKHHTTTILMYENDILFEILKKLFKLYQSNFCIEKENLHIEDRPHSHHLTGR